MGKQNKADAGFSLLEVILSMAILAIISIPLLTYFADSMHYNSRMAQKQGATLLAQQMTEKLKAEETLIALGAGGTDYTVSYLDSRGYTASGSFDAEGKGTVTYAGTDGNYDVEVELSTSVSANDVARPLLYGIDDTKDVLVVEGSQKTEAVSYFTAINSSWVDRNGGTLLSTDTIEKSLSREIRIDIEKSGSDYTVRVYYIYTAGNLQGTGSTNTWTSSYLADVKLAAIEKIYLLYDQILDKNGRAVKDSVVVRLPEDLINPLNNKIQTVLYAICQNPLAGANYYRLSVAGYKWTGSGDGNYVGVLPVHTNIRPASNTGQIEDKDGLLVTADALTATGTPVRLIRIKTSIYKKGHAGSDGPLAVMETTKGE